MRQTAAALLTIAFAFPQLARAQADQPSECTTTTTVHCTGAAAAYGALPGGAQPAPQQPVYPPNTYLPAPGYAQPPLIINIGGLEHDDWHVVRDGDGSFWRERKSSTGAPAVWGTGLGLLISGWAVSGGYSLIDNGEGVPGLGFWPILGSWAQAAIVDSSGARRSTPSTVSCRQAGSWCSSSGWWPAPKSSNDFQSW